MSRIFLGSMLALLLMPAAVVAEPLSLEVEHAEVGFNRATGEPIVIVR